MENKENIEYKAIIEVERLRRITGYLVSDVKLWNNAKKAELLDRVKHIKKEDYKWHSMNL